MEGIEDLTEKVRVQALKGRPKVKQPRCGPRNFQTPGSGLNGPSEEGFKWEDFAPSLIFERPRRCQQTQLANPRLVLVPEN